MPAKAVLIGPGVREIGGLGLIDGEDEGEDGGDALGGSEGAGWSDGLGSAPTSRSAFHRHTLAPATTTARQTTTTPNGTLERDACRAPRGGLAIAGC
jgi:hypothetical protein